MTPFCAPCILSHYMVKMEYFTCKFFPVKNFLPANLPAFSCVWKSQKSKVAKVVKVARVAKVHSAAPKCFLRLPSNTCKRVVMDYTYTIPKSLKVVKPSKSQSCESCRSLIFKFYSEEGKITRPRHFLRFLPHPRSPPCVFRTTYEVDLGGRPPRPILRRCSRLS